MLHATARLSAQAEIDQLKTLIVVQEKILGLQVTVSVTLGVNVR
jgi:hypothetical protein